MLNKTSLLLAAAAVALGAGVAFAGPNDQNGRYDQGQSSEQAAYGNGYSNGYEDGYARHQRDDRFRPDRYSRADYRYERGDYYYGNDCDTTGGTIVGAVAGGVIGNQFGHGDGRTAATLGGVILGGIAGNAIASDMNCDDRRYAFASYRDGFEGRIGQRYSWRTNDRGSFGSFTPVREFSRGGYTCRDFTTITYRHGREYDRSGTACRQNDGNWYLQ
jgi:surface antigen